MSVRSARIALGRINAANVNTNIYTVPADRTLIVKSIWLQNQNAAAGQVVLRAVNSNTGTACRFFDNTAFASRSNVLLQPWAVLEDGDSLELLCSLVNSLNYWISGALLLGDTV